MPARDISAYVVADLSRDQGFSGATVHIDPTQWTTRRRNTVLRALNDGMTSCGHETASFIRNLTAAYGGEVLALSKWSSSIHRDCVKEDKLDELIAYTCTWIRLQQSDCPVTRHLEWWRERVINGESPDHIPSPRIPQREKIDFIKKYLKDDDHVKDVRQSLARKIENGEMLSICVAPRKFHEKQKLSTTN